MIKEITYRVQTGEKLENVVAHAIANKPLFDRTDIVYKHVSLTVFTDESVADIVRQFADRGAKS